MGRWLGIGFVAFSEDWAIEQLGINTEGIKKKKAGKKALDHLKFELIEFTPAKRFSGRTIFYEFKAKEF